jgi:hypothetical protein
MQYVNIFAEQVLEGLGFALEYAKAYAILDMVSAGSYWRYISVLIEKTEYICCS